MWTQIALLVASVAVAVSLDLHHAAGHYRPKYVLMPGLHKESHGHGKSYGEHDHLDKAHGSHNHGYYGGHKKHLDKAYGDHGHYGGELAKHHSDHGSHHLLDADHHDKGIYSRDRGFGYEKAYAYDKVKKHHDVGGHQLLHGGHHGVVQDYHTKHHGGHGSYGHLSHGDSTHHGGHNHGDYSKLSSSHDHYGKNYGHSQKYVQPAHQVAVPHYHDGYPHGVPVVVESSPVLLPYGGHGGHGLHGQQLFVDHGHIGGQSLIYHH